MHYVALTDILGAEDALGDMDFKVAGTRDFVTALQLDTKLDGIPAEMLARPAAGPRRPHTLLDVMGEAIDAPDEMSLYAPRIITVRIPVDKIGEVIGPKGKMINQIQDDTGANISIEDDGTIYIGATNGEAAEAARSLINAIANPTMPEKGERYLGTVVKLMNFGAFVSLMPGKDGLLHISKLRQLNGGNRVENVEDVLSASARRSRSRSPRSTTAASCRWSRWSRRPHERGRRLPWGRRRPRRVLVSSAEQRQEVGDRVEHPGGAIGVGRQLVGVRGAGQDQHRVQAGLQPGDDVGAHGVPDHPGCL
jgi:hypothetical protein